MPNLLEQRTALLADARAVADGAKSDDRDLTEPEQTKIKGLLEAASGLDSSIARAERSQAVFRQLNDLGGEVVESSSGGVALRSSSSPMFLGLTSQARRETGMKLAAKLRAKAGVTITGETITDTPMTGPIEQGRVPTSILDLLPLVRHSSRTYSFMHQTARVFNAAVWSTGPKPVSDIGVTVVEGKLEIVAHQATGVNVYDVLDSPSLEQWIADEMIYGLGTKVEFEVLLGDGTAGHLRGILNTSGIQSQPAGPDVVTTVRSAITKVQTAGYSPGAVVLNPLDWERAETLRTTTGGSFDFAPGAPVDSAAQRLWGVPVALSSTITAGVAAVLDTSAVAIDTDAFGIRVDWRDTSDDDFQRNLMRVRAEGRFGVSVFQAAAVCRVDLPVVAVP